jgi:hypothetical protein
MGEDTGNVTTLESYLPKDVQFTIITGGSFIGHVNEAAIRNRLCLDLPDLVDSLLLVNNHSSVERNKTFFSHFVIVAHAADSMVNYK